MAGVKSFTEIIAWQKAHQLVLKIYEVTQNFPKEELYCLTSQIRRAAISIASNIAEVFERKTTKDSVHFYNIASGSLEEVKYQLILARDLRYVNLEEFNRLFNLAEEAGKLLNGWAKIQK